MPDLKPSDTFLGVIDFFSTLLPGAAAAFLLLNQNKQLVSMPTGWPIAWGSAEGWAVFLVAAYLLGHGSRRSEVFYRSRQTPLRS